MKKQVKKITKKILILSLATSLIFTTCFSHKKIEAKAMGSVVAALSAATLYEICLYVGGTVAVALGVGAVYNNRDEIAEFGKNFIDTLSDASQLGWAIGSIGREGARVYAGDVFNSIKENTWDYIKDGGSYAHIGQDLTGDGVINIADREFELASSNYWMVADGAEFIYSQVESVYDSWVNKEADNILDAKYGAVDELFFDGTLPRDHEGDYVGTVIFPGTGLTYTLFSSYPIGVVYKFDETPFTLSVCRIRGTSVDTYINGEYDGVWGNNVIDYTDPDFSDGVPAPISNLPIFGNSTDLKNFIDNGIINNPTNYRKSFNIADWLDAQRAWTESINEFTTSLRSLQDICEIAMQACSVAVEIAPTVASYKDLLAELAETFPICLDTVANPIYWPEFAPWEKIKDEDLPNSIVIDPPIDEGGEEDEGGDDDNDNIDKEIDLNGLPSIFNIIFYFIMIIIMLIYLFLACLAFIIMIFRIPASSAMLPEEMVLGFEHLKTIMIPGMNISIYGFAMALIYLFIVFAVIKLIRREINYLKVPRSYK